MRGNGARAFADRGVMQGESPDQGERAPGREAGEGGERLSSWAAQEAGSGAGSEFHAIPTPPLAREIPSGAEVAPPKPSRARFEAGELAMVCSHFDVGVIGSIKEYRRGSGRAPKVLLATDQGRFLLKRRGAGPDAQTRVRFCHAIQSFLAKRQFPLPKLVRTRSELKSMLVREGFIYELFEFVEGEGYDYSLDATADAGRAQIGRAHV